MRLDVVLNSHLNDEKSIADKWNSSTKIATSTVTTTARTAAASLVSDLKQTLSPVGSLSLNLKPLSNTVSTDATEATESPLAKTPSLSSTSAAHNHKIQDEFYRCPCNCERMFKCKFKK